VNVRVDEDAVIVVAEAGRELYMHLHSMSFIHLSYFCKVEEVDSTGDL
jgi:hypothetical protein